MVLYGLSSCNDCGVRGIGSGRGNSLDALYEHAVSFHPFQVGRRHGAVRHHFGPHTIDGDKDNVFGTVGCHGGADKITAQEHDCCFFEVHCLLN